MGLEKHARTKDGGFTIMTYNELRSKVKAIYDVQGLDVAIHQSKVMSNKVFTDIVVSSVSDLHKYTYVNKELFCVSGIDLPLGMIERMKNIMEDKE